ncbi:SGNH family hydrolase [Dickeya dadantii]|uniref:SGNH/GDSL hydrolase family protein n=1 Tax=Dickeya dadantii TaxID=204038 RepID=UPI0035A93760
MQTSEYRTILAQVFKSLLVILSCMIGLIWLYQQSINSYWELHFHTKSPWDGITSPSWVFGDRLMEASQAAKDSFVESLTSAPGGNAWQSIPDDAPVAPRQAARPIAPREKSLPPTVKEPDTHVDGNSATRAAGTNIGDNHVVLKAGQAVLFIGDSMMEGVAPHVIKMLRDRYSVEGIDLSKRSTGLTYPHFFNWPLILSHELEKRQDIGALVVFLGSNDPWDMPSGNGKNFLKFESPAWESAYRDRIRSILNLAREKRIPVIWVSPPNVENKKLNHGINYINGLFESEVKAENEISIRVNEIFGYQSSIYSPDMEQDKAKVRIRTNDGVHFSLTGQKMIAERIFSKISVRPSLNEVNH